MYICEDVTPEGKKARCIHICPHSVEQALPQPLPQGVAYKQSTLQQIQVQKVPCGMCIIIVQAATDDSTLEALTAGEWIDLKPSTMLVLNS